MKKYWLKLGLTLLLIAGFSFQSVQAEAGTCIHMFPLAADIQLQLLQLFAGKQFDMIQMAR